LAIQRSTAIRRTEMRSFTVRGRENSASANGCGGALCTQLGGTASGAGTERLGRINVAALAAWRRRQNSRRSTTGCDWPVVHQDLIYFIATRPLSAPKRHGRNRGGWHTLQAMGRCRVRPLLRSWAWAKKLNTSFSTNRPRLGRRGGPYSCRLREVTPAADARLSGPSRSAGSS